jgi:hypothetical protein
MSTVTATPPAEVVVWTLDGKPGPISAQNNYTTNEGYNLLCGTNSEYLTWGKRSVGVNLVWTSDPNVRKIHFRKQNGMEGAIETGELVAFGLGGDPSFLYYNERPAGINLAWSSSPKFEWKIISSSGNSGEAIQPGQTIAIFNVNAVPPDFLVYHERPAGINLGWTTSPDWRERFGDLAFKAGMAYIAARLS